MDSYREMMIKQYQADVLPAVITFVELPELWPVLIKRSGNFQPVTMHV